MRPSLFRDAALKHNQSKWIGDIVLIRPVSFTVLTIFAALTGIAIISLLFFGSYTKRSSVQGQLIPDAGLIKIYAAEPGIILEKYVKDGQVLKQGDALYLLSTTRYGEQGDVQAAISRQVLIRDQSLKDQKYKASALHQAEHLTISNQIGSLQADLATVNQSIASQRQRVDLAKETVARYDSLFRQDYISKEQLQQKQEELLDQQSRLQALERNKISLSAELDKQSIALNHLATKQDTEIAQLNREIASTSQELTESQARQKMVIRATDAGTATLVSAEAGQQADVTKPLLSIMPAQSELVAHLYVPSKAIGFIKPGDQVFLRYQAYPYQKFGHATGRVYSVAKTALPGRELNSMGNLDSENNAENPVYLVKVKLQQQRILAYGKPQPLQAGMLLDADVMHEKRRLYEWVLEPLFSITGKI